MKKFRINHFCYTFSSHVWIKTHSRLDNHCLFAGLETAALTAVVAAVLVQFYLYIGFLQLSALRKPELDVFYGQAAVQPLLFVIGADAENIIHQSGVVEVVGDELYGKPVLLYHVFGVGEHEVAVGLYMDSAAVFQELAVAFHEVGGRKAFGGFLHLRVGEREPYLAHFAWSEEAVYDFDVGTQEGNILHARLQGLGSSRPHARPFDIHANEILVGKHASQSHRVLSTAAAQLQHNRIIVLEKLLMPVALHLKRHVVHRRVRIFKHVRITRHIGKLL